MIRILDTNLNFVEYMRKYTFSQYSVKFRGIGTFMINALLDNENLYLLDKTKQFFVLFSGKTEEQFGIIEGVEKSSDSETEQMLVISGRMSNAIFDKRVVYRTLKFRGKTYDFVKTVIDDNLIHSEDESRNMNINLVLSDPEGLENACTDISKQVTGGILWDTIEPILEVDAIGVKFVPVVTPKKIETDVNIAKWNLTISKGVDRRKGNPEGNKSVIFSQSVSNIKRTEYYVKSESYKNYAYIAGEGVAGERKWYTKEINVHDSKGNTGWNRSELWIDARDIQSEDTEGNVIPDEQYEKLIDERINEKAEENAITENYNSTIVQENKLYEYGKDYFLGDFVTVIDKELNITIDVQITEVTLSEQGSQTILDIGLTYGAIKRDIVQQININKKTSTVNENSIRYLEAQIKKVGSGGGGGSGTTPPVTNIDNIAVNFDYASGTEQRKQLSTGDTVSTLFKKIRKWFSDLGSVAFTGSYDDLINKPTTLPNPFRLTFTGGATGVYDGSAAKTIAIPTVPSSIPADGGNADTIGNKNLDFLLDYNNHTNRPEKLPNPEKLIFTGAVTAEYDGSVQKTIEIPQGGGGTEYYDFVGTDAELQEAIQAGTVTAGMKTWVTDDPEDGDSREDFVGLVLWENSIPEAVFLEQDIDLIDAEYTRMVIYYKTGDLMFAETVLKGHSTILSSVDGNAIDEHMRVRYRFFNRVSDRVYHVSKAYSATYNATTDLYQNLVKPYKIVGYRT